MSEDKELKVMESRVREAMKSCPDAKEVLETLFGEQLGGLSKPSAPTIQEGDIVRGKGTHDDQNIDGFYGLAKDSSSPHHIIFFNWENGWGNNRAHWGVPKEKLELVYRPEK